MVAPQQRHVGWVARLEQQQQREHLQAVVAAVHKVTHEDVAGAGHLPASLKQPQQVMELPMDVTTHLVHCQCMPGGQRWVGGATHPLPHACEWYALLCSYYKEDTL